MRIILCVTNDIETDQRVNRIANSLKKLPADILIAGTFLPGSILCTSGKIPWHRIKMFFKKGPLFYAEYNIRLFFYLLFIKADIFVSNDLDTLPAVFIASLLKQKPVVYDSHEYFTELPELVDRPLVKKVWQGIEARILPRLKYSYTVSSSIALDYNRKYGLDMQVIRNLPVLKGAQPTVPSLRKEKEKLVIYQGVLNMGRGLELAIRAMQYVDYATLIICGTGYFEKDLQELAISLKLNDKIRFLGRIHPDKLALYTSQADLGISLEENKGLNYYYALPNKLFDYIQAQIPVLVSNMPEMANIIHHYGVGEVISTGDPAELSKIFREMLFNESKRSLWKANLMIAAKELCWENEEKKLLDIYQKIKHGVLESE
jgi:glycosyltransferase involved in cell wall biosynthesis